MIQSTLDLRAQVTRAAFTVRMFAVMVALLVSAGHTLSARTLLAYSVALGLSWLGLTRLDLLERVRQHPSLAMLDTVILAGATLLSGAKSPLSLALLTTALILGLWVDVWGGLIVVVTLVALHVWGVTATLPGGWNGMTFSDELLITPFLFLAFWYLGITIRRSVEAQEASRGALVDTIQASARSDERALLSQELHDSLAKTLQGIMLTASALPAHFSRNPEEGVRQAGVLRSMAAQAVADVRVVMGDLRDSAAVEPLPTVLGEAVSAFADRTGRVVPVDVDPDADTTVPAVRHELLRVLDEALDNAHRHAGTCTIDVSLALRGPDLVLTVRDTGRGVSDDRLLQAGQAGHYGVTGLHERMARIGGRLEFTSAPGAGTTVRAIVHRKGLIERGQ